VVNRAEYGDCGEDARDEESVLPLAPGLVWVALRKSALRRSLISWGMSAPLKGDEKGIGWWLSTSMRYVSCRCCRVCVWCVV
jgi:hypothetical protein